MINTLSQTGGPMKNILSSTLCILSLLFSLSACTHTIKVEPSDKPITINMNIKHDLRVRVERDVKKLFDKNKDIF